MWICWLGSSYSWTKVPFQVETRGVPPWWGCGGTGSSLLHSQLDHQRVTAQSCRTLTYSEAVWHIKSGRQGVSQRGRQPRLHNNDLRRSWDRKFLKQTSMSLSTSGFGASENGACSGGNFSQRSLVQLPPQRSPVPPRNSFCVWFKKGGATCEDVGCRSVEELISTFNYLWDLDFAEHIGGRKRCYSSAVHP